MVSSTRNLLRCNRCDSIEELMWTETWKKGDRPVSVVTGIVHECSTNNQQSTNKFIKIPCPVCKKIVYHNPRHKNYNPKSLCSDCEK